MIQDGQGFQILGKKAQELYNELPNEVMRIPLESISYYGVIVQ